MTALPEYQRLEALGIWRAHPDAQRLDVVVSIGDATLVITDMREQALTHWSLPAVQRANPGQRPALYHPDGDPGETLEFAEDAPEMIAAIEKLRTAIARTRPHPGRLRLVSLCLMCLSIALLAVFWMPEQLHRHAVTVVPDAKRIEIGADLLVHMQDVTGTPCNAPGGKRALTLLTARLQNTEGSARLMVMPAGVRTTVTLPGKAILIGRTLVEDHEDPDVLAGYIIAEHLRGLRYDPLDQLLRHAGLGATIRLLTTGRVPDANLDAYAKHILARPVTPVADATLLDGFRNWTVRAAPFAYARDISGESTLALIEADPFAGQVLDPVLSDGDWLRLQGICDT